jgi:hypothetical protein
MILIDNIFCHQMYSDWYTFNNISVTSWWSVLLVEETRVSQENASTLYHRSRSGQKKICLFTVNRPTLVHFIGKSKVKEIFGINFFYYTTAIIFLRYYNTFTPESNQIYSKVRYLFRIRIGPQSEISVCEIKWKNKIKWKSDLPTLFFWRM